MRRVTVMATLFVTGACARAVPPAVAPPAPVAAPVARRPAPPTTRENPPVLPPTSIERALPPVPAVDGPLAISVVYPRPNQLLTARDSNFIFGSVGSGEAKLTINGDDVPVYPNGAFMGWLPVPSGDHPRYDLSVSKGDEQLTATVPVRAPPPVVVLADTGKLVIDAASAAPTGRYSVRSDEQLRVSLRAPANATVTLRLTGGASYPLQRGGTGAFSAELPARELARGGTIVARRGRDSVSVPVAAPTLVDQSPRRFAALANANEDAVSDTDQVSILRPTPGGTYKWFFFPGTVLEVTGQRGASYRLRIDDQLEAWTDERAIHLLPEGTIAPRRIASNATVITNAKFTDLRIPVTDRPGYQVDESPDALTLTLYGTAGNVDIVNFSTDDPTVRTVTWEQVTSDRVRFTVKLRGAPAGYLALWDRGAFVLRVRHAPAIDPARPLSGRVIAIDPGHPPIGSTGPTGLYEGDAVLDVAEQLKPMLEERGATVIMTRTTRAAVPLGERPITARRADADVFVSIHLNAQPDGVNPLRRNGTGTYYFYAQAEPLARALQRGLVRQMGLRDLGVNYDNLAVARNTWMPSVLCEGAFVIVPEQEAALRTTEFQQRYAMGIVEGLEDYFRQVPR